ncbi:Pheophytinase, chloroplastic, partial [Cucurbita argyrosperma subsp. argyrosperma]
ASTCDERRKPAHWVAFLAMRDEWSYAPSISTSDSKICAFFGKMSGGWLTFIDIVSRVVREFSQLALTYLDGTGVADSSIALLWRATVERHGLKANVTQLAMKYEIKEDISQISQSERLSSDSDESWIGTLVGNQVQHQGPGQLGLLPWLDWTLMTQLLTHPYFIKQRNMCPKSVVELFLRGGTEGPLNALAAYIRYNEGTSRDDWQALHEMVRNSESRDGASFIKLFGPAIHLGMISKRRVHYEAIKYEKERNAGFLSPFGYSAGTVAAAVDAVLSSEWYSLMCLKSKGRHLGSLSYRTWRWNGFLVQYTVYGCDGPAMLLVHGFGAFLEHFRDNIHGIAEGGNQVWAITMLGFGSSEKPNIVYSELMWAELLKDFIVQVVGRPVHLVGNSIGGYIVAIVACLWPALVKSIVLINSAGSVIPGYSSLPFNKVSFLNIIMSQLSEVSFEYVRGCALRPHRRGEWILAYKLDPSFLLG